MHSILKDSRLQALLAAVAAALGLGLTIAIVDDDGDGRPERVSVTVDLRGHDEAPVGVPAGPAELELGPVGVDELAGAKADEGGDHAGEVDERPAGVPAEDLLAAVRQQEAYARSDLLPDLTPLAAPSQRGCSTKLVGNYSSRNGVRPRLFVLHYTVSPNRPGRGDVDGITAYFNNAGAQASSHYVIDNEGNCNYIVRETSKSWTQGVFNPVSISVEVINTGSERSYAGTAGLAKLGQVVSDSTKRWEIPLQRGAVNANCTVARAGVIDHDALTCNDHTDIRPFDVDQVIAAARRVRVAGSSPSTKRERVLIHRLHQLHRNGRKATAGEGPSRRRTCRLARKQLRRINPPYTRTEKRRHQGSRRKALVKPYARQCR